MTRTDKIRKLSNAIKEYRGRYHEASKKWIYPPNQAALGRVYDWLEKLQLPVQNSVDAINNFKSIKEYEAWIKSI